MRAQAARRAVTVSEYHRMARTGVLTEDDRVELLDGVIFRMSPIGSPHAACVDRLTALLTRALGDRAIVRVQNPIIVGRLSEPQPDVVVLQPRDDFYAARHPGPREVFWLIEVTTGRDDKRDRVVKLPLYARFGIAEVWIVDLRRAAIEVYRQPTLRGYRSRHDLGPGDRLASLAFPRKRLAVSAVLGRP